MNIAMVSIDYPPTVGGIAAHVYELSKALSGAGHRVSVLTRRFRSMDAAAVPNGGVSIFRFRLRIAAPVYGWQINRFIDGKLPALRPDIIHIHGMAPLEGYRAKAIPLVYTNHTSGYLRRIEKGGIRRMALIRRLFKKPDLFLAPSRELLETPFEIDAPKVYIPNGVDGGKYRFDEEARKTVRASLGLAEDHMLAILTRRLVEKNGVGYLADATRHIRNPNLRLLIIGDGKERPAIERSLSSHFADRFTMLGTKTHDEIIPYYSAADVAILPSLKEATSISGLEAMAAGLPLVGTRVGGIPALIEDGVNGKLCRPADPGDLADKIDRVLAGDLKAMGAESRKMIDGQFHWSRIAGQTLAAYESIL